jgi:hypothetical protein
MGTLQVLVKPWGSIFIDGKLHKIDTDVVYTVQQPMGEHRLQVEHPVLGAFYRSVQVSSDTTFVTVDFQNTAQVLVTARPVAGQIYVNGHGTERETPALINLATGRHTLDVQRSGWISVEGPRDMVIQTNDADTLSFTLEENRSPQDTSGQP